MRVPRSLRNTRKLNRSDLKYYSRLVGIILTVTISIFVVYKNFFAQAATITWDGGGATNNWSDCDNWSTNTCPTSSDIATFNATSTKDATVDASFAGSVLGLNIASGYTGTITLARNLSVGMSDYIQASGTFNAASFTLTLDISAGNADFTKTGGTFNAGTGTVNISGLQSSTFSSTSSETFYNLTINDTFNGDGRGFYVTTGQTLTVSHDLNLTDGGFFDGTINAQGNITQAAAFSNGLGDGTINFSSASPQTYTINGGAGPILRLDEPADASDSIIFNADATLWGLNITAGFSGTVNTTYNGHNLTLLNSGFTQAAGTFNAPDQLSFTAPSSFTKSGGTFNEGTGTININGSCNCGTTFNVDTTETFYNLTINQTFDWQGLTVTSGDTLVVTNNLTLTNGGLYDGTVNVMGNITQAAAFGDPFSDATVNFSSPSAQTYTINGGTTPILKFDEADDASDSVILNADATFDGINITSGFSGTVPITYNNHNLTIGTGGYTQAAGTFNAPNLMDFHANSSSGGTSLTKTGGTFNPGTGTVSATGTCNCGITFNVASTETFYNLTVNETFTGLTIGAGDTLVTTGTFTHTAGSVNNGTIEAQGDVVIGSGAGGGSTLLNFKGSANQTYTDNGGNEPDGDVTINKPSGTVTLASNADWNASNQDLTITSGTLDQGPSFNLKTANVTIGVSGTWQDIGTGDITLGGNVSNSGAITIDGTSAGCGDADAIAITSTSTPRTWSGSGTFTIYDVDVSNMAGSMTARSSTNTTNNTWSFLNCITQFTQSDYRWYANVDSNTPGSPSAAENTGVVGNTSTPLRLRENVTSTLGNIPASSAQFKLQVGTSVSGPWVDVNPSWWNSSWLNRRKITFDNSGSGTNLTNFPVLIALSSANIDYSKTQNSGQDIRFVDPDGTALNYQIEKWDETGTSYVWVNVPQIDAGSTSDYVWVYYNNNAATDGQTASSVWDANYGGVWHLNDASGTTTINDSTGNANTGTRRLTTNPSPATGQIANGQTFNGSSDYIIAADNATLRGNDITIEAWIHPTTITDTMIVAKENGTGSDDSYAFWFNSNTLSFFTGGTILGYNGLTAGNWYHVAATKSGTNAKIYVNGTEVASSTSFPATISYTACPLIIGNDDNSGCDTPDTTVAFDGILDEVRFSNTARSADFIQAAYKTEAQTMNIFGDEQTYGVNMSFHDNPTPSDGATLSSALLSSSNVAESYEENNPTAANPNAINFNQSAEYDFSLDPSGLTNTNTYYFRLVDANDQVLNSYTNYPTLTIQNNTSPNAPSSLSLSGGSWTNDNTPTLTFDLSDPDGSDTIKYQIQIDDNSDFSSPVVDYTSALAAQGSFSFTVGQSAGSGSYTVGSSGQTLSDGPYYYQVKSIDSFGASSAFVKANSGGIAFKIDTAAPTAGTLSINTRTTTSITVQVAGASDADSGLAASPYLFTNTTEATNSGQTNLTSWSSTTIAVNTPYDFTVDVTDQAGNTAQATLNQGYTLANPPSNLVLTVDSPTQITVSWDANSNPNGTEFFASNDTNSTDSGWISATSHVFSGLTSGTSYSFSVKARNGDNVETAAITGSTQTTSTGGGLPPQAFNPPTPPPGGFKVTINNDQATTDSRNVSLSFNFGSDVTMIMVSNVPDFSDAGQIAAVSALQWDLCSTANNSIHPTNCSEGTHSVYAKFYNQYGQSTDPVSDSITLQTQTPPPPPPPPPPVPTPTPSPSPAPTPTPSPEPSPSPVPTDNGVGNGGFDNGNHNGQGNGQGNGNNNGQGNGNNNKVCPADNQAINQQYRDDIQRAQDLFAATMESARAARRNMMDQSKNLSENAKKQAQQTAEDIYHRTLDLAISTRKQAFDQALSRKMQAEDGVCPEDMVDVPPITGGLDGSSDNGSDSTPSSSNGGGNGNGGIVETILTPITAASTYILNNYVEAQATISTAYITNVPPGVQDRIDAISDFIESIIKTIPFGDALVSIAAPVITVAAVPIGLSFASTGFQAELASAVGSYDLILILIRYFYGLLSLLGLRKKRLPWGTVYDSVTKQPLDPVLVSLIDATTGKTVETAITDLNGMYGFLMRTGTFIITAKKSHYDFPSTKIKGDTDSIYTDLYFGQKITLKDSAAITPNIPMDPVAFDWNQEAKKDYVVVRPSLVKLTNSMFSSLFWLGFIFVVATFLAHRSMFDLGLTTAYLILIAVRSLMSKPKLLGEVQSRNKGPLKVALSFPGLANSPIVSAHTLPDGKFFLKANPGKYTLEVLDEQTNNILFQTDIKVGKDRVVNKRIKI